MKNKFNYLLTGVLLVSIGFLTSCGDDDEPAEENPEEEITRVTLTFTPDGGGTPVTAVWFDVDGEEGPTAPTKDEIDLAANTAYTLDITLTNTLEDPEEDITEEIGVDEPDEHMFFFGFTANVFSNPTGDGNIGATNRNDPMNYLDTDGTYPVGLETAWTTGDATTGASFTVILKHQPEGQKTATSTSETGDEDINLEFVLNIND